MEKKNLVMVVLCVAIGIMAVAYAAFQTAFTVEGTVQATGEFAVEFQGGSCTGTPAGPQTPAATAEVTGAKISFKTFEMYTPGDVIVCTFTIKNTGNLAAELTNQEISNGWDDTTKPIKFEVSDAPAKLAADASDTVTLTFTYDWQEQTQPGTTENNFGVTFYYGQEVN